MSYIMTAEHRRKLSLAKIGKTSPRKGVVLTDTQKAKMAEASKRFWMLAKKDGKAVGHTGIKHSSESKALISQNRKGKLCGMSNPMKRPEVRAKQLEVFKKKSKAITKICPFCKKEFKTYLSLEKYGRGKFCSQKCAGRFNAKELSIARMGENNPMYGVPLSQKRINALKAMDRRGKNNPHYGKKNSAKWYAMIAVRDNRLCGQKNYKRFTRNDLGCAFRSTWEANYARILNHNKIKWEYETKEIHYIDETGKTRRWLMDFYLPEFNQYHETKARWKHGNEIDFIRWELMTSQNKHLSFKMISNDEYKDMCNKYSSKILGWEK